MSGRVRLYEIYPRGGGFSTRTVDYHGQAISVAAVSIRQAYWLAGRGMWASSADNPVGIVESYGRNSHPGGWYRLWDGCRIHGGLCLDRAASRTAITRAMRRHLADHHETDGEST
jgi:hypothetical protein